MEPKSPKFLTAADTAAMKAVAAGATTEPPAKLTKPVADTKGFRTASWNLIPPPAHSTDASASSTFVPPTRPPQQRPNAVTPSRTELPRTDGSPRDVQQELAEIKTMIATLTEAIRDLQASISR